MVLKRSLSLFPVESLLGIEIQQCPDDNSCVYFGRVAEVNPVQWLSVPLNSSSLLSESIKIIKRQNEDEPFQDVYICDIEAFGSKYLLLGQTRPTNKQPK